MMRWGVFVWLAGLLWLPVTLTANEPPAQPRSFNEAKKLAARVWQNQAQSFYCGCRYNQKLHVDASSCGYRPRKNARRGRRIEWEHVVPAHAFGHTLSCWREPLCTTKKGRRYKGRRCCERLDERFRLMVSDLYNLVPAVGELNGDRSNFSYAMIEGEPREYGQCDFEVDFSGRRAEPRPGVRGDIARSYFYMHTTYGLPISKKQRRLFEAWDRQDPVDDAERARATRIEALQGNRNPFIR